MDMENVFEELNQLNTIQQSFIKDEEMTKKSKDLKRFFSVLMLVF